MEVAKDEALHYSEAEKPETLTFGIGESTVVKKFNYFVVKRVIDIIVSGIGLLVLSPLFLLVAFLIKLTSPGEVFYAWNVIGKGGKPFTGYKFRTMVRNADKLKAELGHLNEMKGPVFKSRNDPRITRIGKFLRKYSIDELPQLWSVFKGDMSLVGPRPAFQAEWGKYEIWQKHRLSVTPGITCLWQVMGRNHISDFDDWVRLDLDYINNWSLKLDFKILYKTFEVILKGTGV